MAESFTELKEKFFAEIGSEVISPDSDTIEIEMNDVEVLVEPFDAADISVAIYTVVGHSFQVDFGDFCKALLELNFKGNGTGGGTLSVMPGTTSVVLSEEHELDILTGKLLAGRLQEMVQRSKTIAENADKIVAGNFEDADEESEHAVRV